MIFILCFCNLRVRAPRYQIIPPETDLNLPPLLHNIQEKVLPIAAVRTGKGTTLWNVWIIRMFVMTSKSLFSFLILYLPLNFVVSLFKLLNIMIISWRTRWRLKMWNFLIYDFCRDANLMEYVSIFTTGWFDGNILSKNKC